MEQAEVLSYVFELLERLGLPYMVVGSFASAAYGEPRSTLDLDVVIEITAPDIDRLCAAFPPSDFYVSLDAAKAALKLPAGQFNVLHATSGFKIDFMIARKDAWGKAQLSRRQRVPILPGIMGYAARPEDIIIGKMLYYQEGGSEKHMRDITGMLKTVPAEIDKGYISQWATKLDLDDIWQVVLDRLKT